ncbi:hypothetical protein Ddye_012951 [Dipteronia dyeriana]|uniref:DDE Tnp4 domain-containing protein n=1 Tax=Dipteronia dyeriana TaxID=168575 RepID=A0AAE0CJ66_9ROSI|nr:hypothetical protein Ddye_012951 [Dipteronia dyeriana]
MKRGIGGGGAMDRMVFSGGGGGDGDGVERGRETVREMKRSRECEDEIEKLLYICCKKGSRRTELVCGFSGLGVSISLEDQIPYISRKRIPTQNVIVACDFKMQFIFVVASWEDTAHDSRILQKTILDPALNFPKPPKVAAGYPQMSGYLGPNKCVRYHIPDFRRGKPPIGPREVSNQAHSSLRRVIEHTFRVWKKKWKILKTMSNFSFNKKVKIVIASMALHNYITRHAQRDRHFEESKNYQDE